MATPPAAGGLVAGGVPAVAGGAPSVGAGGAPSVGAGGSVAAGGNSDDGRPTDPEGEGGAGGQLVDPPEAGHGGQGGAAPVCSGSNLLRAELACPDAAATDPYPGTTLRIFNTASGAGDQHTVIAEAMNQSGLIVGIAYFCEDFHAFAYQDGTLTDLTAYAGAYAGAHDVNEAGVIVGAARVGAVVWESGVMRVLFPMGSAVAINNLNQILVQTNLDNYVMDDRGIVAELGPSLLVNDINDRGQVVGASIEPDGQRRAFIWESGVFTWLPPLPGHPDAIASAINELGQVVGESGNLGQGRAVLWDGELATDISVTTGDEFINSEAVDINDAGMVLVNYLDGGRWQNGGSYVYLEGNVTWLDPDGGGVLARAVNARGDIVGLSSDRTRTNFPARVWPSSCLAACCDN